MNDDRYEALLEPTNAYLPDGLELRQIYRARAYRRKIPNLADELNQPVRLDEVSPIMAVLGDLWYWDGTQFKRIPIGTANQILVVSANGIPTWTDIADVVTWATTSDIADVADTEAAGTAETFPRGDHVHKLGILTTKGDIVSYSTLPARLGVGANDTVLMADSAQTTGLKWAASGTPSTQALGDAAAEGSTDGFTRTDHKHAMPAAASTTDVLTGTDTADAVTADALAALWEQGSDIASAGTISIGEGGFFHVTGTTTITDIDFGTTKAGRAVWLVFDGALTLTHNATTLILPTGANITTEAGDSCLVVSEGGDNVRVVVYYRKDGEALVGGAGSLTVEEEDGTPSVSSVSTIKVSNATLTDNGGGSVSIATGGGGSGDSVSVNGTNATDADFDDADPAAPSGHVNVQWQINTATSPDSISAYVAAGWEFVSEIDISDDATAEFVLANTSYADYMFLLQAVVPVTDAVPLFIRTSTDGGLNYDSGAGDYNWMADVVTQTASAGATADDADTEIEIRATNTVFWGSDTDEHGSGIIFLIGPAAAAQTRFVWQFGIEASTGGYSVTNGMGSRLSAADVDAVQFLFSSGNLESGRISLYGLRPAA